MILVALLALPVIYFWASATTVVMLAASAFLMQVCVQGAWGVIPAHLTELSPAEIRGFYPGVTYQLGNLIAALNLPLQTSLADSHSGPFALLVVMFPVLAAVIILTSIGSEARGVRFAGEETSVAARERVHAGAGRFRRPVPDTTRIRT